MKKLDIGYIIVFLLLLMIPSGAMLFGGETENTEKRALAEKPSLIEGGSINREYGTQLDAWLSDHIGLRGRMVSVESSIMDRLFGQSAVSSVILGDDGWLYYADELNDYMNVATLSQRNINNVARTLLMVQQSLTAKEHSFVFVTVPNKSSLYPHLPERYVPLAQDGNLESLQKALAEHEVCYANLQRAFSEDGRELYQKTDTHWTYQGALLAYRTIMAAVGYPHDEFETMTFEDRLDWSGDLAVMLYSTAAELDWQSYPVGDWTYEYTSHEKAADSLLLRTAKEGGQGSVVMYRDSFGDTLHRLVAESAAEATFSRIVPYDISMADRYAGSLVILEIVERNLANLAAKAPLMAAPAVNLDVTATAVSPASVTAKSEETEEFLHVFGEIDESLLKDEYRVYILVSDGKGGRDSYEAFPVYETELMGGTEQKDNGFSAYIPADAKGKDIAVLVESDGEYYLIDGVV